MPSTATVGGGGDGIVEAIRVLRVTRRAVKARTQTANQLRSLLLTAPAAPWKRLIETPALVTA